MYRLIKLSSGAFHSSCKTQNVQYSSRTCFYCNFRHCNTPKPLDFVQLRQRSTTASNVLLSSVGKRKLKRRTKKYAELLEVTESTSNNRKAAVQNLNAAQLSILVDQPDITLDKLHKIKYKRLAKSERTASLSTLKSKSSSVDHVLNPSTTDISEFANSLKSKTSKQSKQANNLYSTIDNEEVEAFVAELQSSGIVNETMLIRSSYLADSICNSNDQLPNKNIKLLENSEELQNLEESEDQIIANERKAREASIYEDKLKQYNKAFLAYMNVCVNSNVINCKQDFLQTLRRKKNQKSGRMYLNNISIFNFQIEKLASSGNTANILQILKNLRKDKINFNVQTYAHIFESIGRMDGTTEHKLDLLKQIQIDMKKDEITLNDVVTNSVFTRDQKDYIIKIVKLLDNKFEPTYKLPDIDYDCRLLNQFSSESATPSSTVGGLLNISDFESRLKKQIEMEIKGQITVQNVAVQNISKQTIQSKNVLLNIEQKWAKVALSAFNRNLTMLTNREKLQYKSKMLLYVYLRVLDPKDFVYIIMNQVRKLGMGSEMYSLPFNSLCYQLGVQVYKMYETKIKENTGVIDKVTEVYLKYCDWFINRNDKHNSRTKWTLLEHESNKYGVTLSAEIPTWQSNIHCNIGRFLYNIIINDFKIDSTVNKKRKSRQGHTFPAFFKVFKHSGIVLKEEVVPHPILAKLYKESSPETLTFDTTLVPSVVPPRPWVSIHNGGYIITKTDVVRVSNMDNQQWARLLNTPPNKLYPALDSLNQLGSIPWTINKSILDIALEVFRNGGSIKLNMPQPPSVLPPAPFASNNADPEEKKKINKIRMELKRKKNEMYSLWCDALYRLSLANHFKDDIFWLPHNMDFRGRVYPVPPHLNHLGSDLARSMLIFALKKPLGPNGLDWLKLHTINLTGFKKRDPISERLKYADEVMDKILDSAENPLTGEMWWATSDEPWQTLAACKEIAAALKSPNPAEFLSGFPVHQDGSCNGLQHYAALGRDQVGAESVNLYPSDRPQDVYNSVATMVDELRKADADDGNKIAQALEGFIKRKVIKQTVMTTVYGVTWFGAKLQIARQLKDLDNFPQEHLWPASTYLVQKTFQTLRTMFKSAREIQDWFTECARLICVTRDQNMEWVTPLGLPVIQPYSKCTKSAISCSKGITPFFTSDIYRKPYVMKQKNAFAPNFVHSLDSSHMMLTSIHCEHAGITFVSVHDCYWTHPCTTTIMNRICREQFVALHSEPILQDLSAFLVQKFSFAKEDLVCGSNKSKQVNKYLLRNTLNSTLTKVPQHGEFDLNGVLNATYFFS